MSSDIIVPGQNVFTPNVLVPGDGTVFSQAAVSASIVQPLANRTTWLKNQIAGISQRVTLSPSINSIVCGLNMWAATGYSGGFGYKFTLNLDSVFPDYTSRTLFVDAGASLDFNWRATGGTARFAKSSLGFSLDGTALQNSDTYNGSGNGWIGYTTDPGTNDGVGTQPNFPDSSTYKNRISAYSKCTRLSPNSSGRFLVFNVKWGTLLVTYANSASTPASEISQLSASVNLVDMRASITLGSIQ
jgi:hypothetical protein